MYLRKEDRWKLLVFLLPAVVLFIAYFLYPLIYVIVMSFYKWDAFHPPEYRGFANYAALFKDLTFRRALGNNLTWAGVDMAIKVPLAMMMALILSKKIRGWKFFRTVYFLPQVISGIAMAAMWSAVYNLDYGLLNGVVKLFGGQPVNWLGNVKVAFICVIAYGLLYIGYFMVIMMAEITGIDTTYYEAAAIDGATNLQTDIHITIPMIRSSLATCITLAAVFGLRAFEQVYLLTEGGPANRTMTMVLFIYKKMNANVYGTANAAAVLLIIMGILVMSLVRKIVAGKD
ncbi:MAG: sugar ABC transporter permease [Oscillospiraceae bacterium]|nr:sugar ABC transporter permease [Oscillospiraceae bacterium]